MDPINLLAFSPVGRRPRRTFGSAVARRSFGTLGAALLFVVHGEEKKVAPRQLESSVEPEHSKGAWGVL